MRNKKFAITSIIIIMLFSINLSGCNFNETALQENPNKLISVINSIGKTPKDVFNRAWKVIKDQYVDKSCNDQDLGRWKKRYINRIKTYDDAHVAIETMVESLNDPYTRFLTPYDFAEQNRNIDAKLFGIGVHIMQLKDRIVIANVIQDTPAKAAGLLPGDLIIKVNSKLTKGMDVKQVADMVRGKANTNVTLTLLRRNQQIVKKITRKKIDIKSVEYKVLKGNYGYIRIISFISSETYSEMLKALDSTQKAKGLIIDLRGNQGGLLPNAIFIANLFMDKGDIVSIVNRNGKREVFEAKHFKDCNTKPLVILVNEGSASASEILSGALKDNKRAVLVGQKTFGKGEVQKICRLPDGSGINITIAKYLTPNGTDIDKKGIMPDYNVKLTQEDFLHNRDPQLDKAKQVLANQIINTYKNKSKVAMAK